MAISPSDATALTGIQPRQISHLPTNSAQRGKFGCLETQSFQKHAQRDSNPHFQIQLHYVGLEDRCDYGRKIKSPRQSRLELDFTQSLGK